MEDERVSETIGSGWKHQSERTWPRMNPEMAYVEKVFE